MKVVSTFEQSLLTIARTLTGQVPLDDSLFLFRREHPRPSCLSRAAVELLEDTLAKGVILRLASLGWQEGRTLREGSVVSGRLWERVPLEHRQLHFSGQTVELLMWMTAENLQRPGLPWRHDPQSLTLGDELLLLLAMMALEETQCVGPLLAQQAFREQPLIRLLYPDQFLERKYNSGGGFSPWLTERSSWVLEALQPLLVERWSRLERSKRDTSSRKLLLQLGHRQKDILTEFLDAIDAAGRRDLARFLLVMADRMLAPPQPEKVWFANLDVRGASLQIREEAYRSGLSVLESLARLADWQRQAVGIGYYDEGYAASQLWKSQWEVLRGDVACERAAALVRNFTSLRQWEHA